MSYLCEPLCVVDRLFSIPNSLYINHACIPTHMGYEQTYMLFVSKIVSKPRAKAQFHKSWRQTESHDPADSLIIGDPNNCLITAK